ncbi:MAG TPA: diaminopimelate decarboxylase [Candidatus Sulfotelmatobacter sp.]|jgi:diaminopimelate decarboxylase
MRPRSDTTQMERPPGFIFRQLKGPDKGTSTGILHCEQVPLTTLAQRYRTPLYVYSASAILERVSAFNSAFRAVPHTICYSVKANSNLSILRLLARAGCGFDVVSGGELERVTVADKRGSRHVVFSGVGKTPDEMTAALRAGILLFNLESESEISKLAEYATRLRRTARVALRVNPDVAAETHPYISTGLHKHKFGIPIRRARELYAKAAKVPNLKVAGVSVHIGSQITDVAPFLEAAERVAELILQLRADGHRIDYIDVGGGLGIDYQEPRQQFADRLGQYARAVIGPLRKLKIHLLLEPGRSIVGPAGALLTSVIYKKSNNGKRFLVVDAAMNDLIRPALYGAHHEIVPVIQPKDGSTKTEMVDVVGPICESGDFFARDRQLASICEGELLAILDAGAYGMALASNYNSRPRPAELLVRGKSVKLIRRRETVRDLYRAEL